MSRKNTTNRVLASAAAIAIASSGLGSFAIANAQDNDVNPPKAEVEYSSTNGPLARTFPADGTSSLTIHKKVNPDKFGKADGKGQAQDNTPGDKAGEGYTFTLTPIATGDQLTDQTVFNELAKISQTQDRTVVSRINVNEKLKAKNITADANGKAAYTLKTDKNGEATETGIKNGVYLVQEKESPDDTTSKVHPFLVFLPQPDPQAIPKATASDGDWNNAVHVYPKNGRTNINKTVVDKDKNVGETVKYTLSATVPASAQNETLTKFNLRDIFNDKELGEFKVDNSVVERKGGAVDKIEVKQGEATATDESTLGGNTKIEYEVPVEGLKAGDIVKIELSATLLETREDSEIINEARTVVRHSGDDSDHVTKPVEVRTYVGDIEITKFSDLNNDKKLNEGEEVLEGAVFELYRTKEEAEARVKNLDGKKPENAVGHGTTDKEGKIKFEGLHVNDFADNAEVANHTGYFLVEVKAPEGFQLPNADENIKELKLTKAEHSTQEGNTLKISHQAEIPNIPEERFMPELPGTGQNGVYALGLLAFLLLGGAGVYAAARNRKTA